MAEKYREEEKPVERSTEEELSLKGTLAFRQITTEAGMTRSMSRLATCTDNAPMESFFGHFKCECYDLKMYHTFEALESDIEQYIEFYNHKRLQAQLNSLAPVEFRAQAAA